MFQLLADCRTSSSSSGRKPILVTEIKLSFVTPVNSGPSSAKETLLTFVQTSLMLNFLKAASQEQLFLYWKRQREAYHTLIQLPRLASFDLRTIYKLKTLPQPNVLLCLPSQLYVVFPLFFDRLLSLHAGPEHCRGLCCTNIILL